MGLKDSAKKAAANAAGIAAATTGLSTCHDGGGIVVDPVVPPLVCSTVGTGQPLVATATREGNAVTTRIKIGGAGSTGSIFNWQVTKVAAGAGATIRSSTFPSMQSDSLVVVLDLDAPNTTRVDLTVEANFTGPRGELCAMTRVFHLTIGANDVQVAESNFDRLPLAARQRARIHVVARDGRTVALEAHSAYAGARTVAWEITGGDLRVLDARSAHWTLPAEPGLYQAELVMDYGDDGLSFDALMLEVRA